MAIDPKDLYLNRGLSSTNDVRLAGVFVATNVIACAVAVATESYASDAVAEAITSSVTASSETKASGTLAEAITASVTAVTETKSAGVLAEAITTAVTAVTETKTLGALAESFATSVAAVTESLSAAVLAETLSLAVQAVTETYAALAMVEVVNVDAVIDASTETGSDSIAGVLNPQGPVRTAAGGPTGTKHRKRFIFPEPEPAFAEAAFTPSKPWTPESDAPDDELLEVFAMMVNEDLF